MNFQPIDIVALIITVSICLMLIIVILNAAIRGIPLSIEAATRIENLTIAMIAIVSYYMGKHSDKKL